MADRSLSTAVCDALTRLGDAIKNTNGSSTTLKQNHGWNYPILTATEIAEFAFSLKDRIEAGRDKIDELELDIDYIILKIDYETSNLPQYFWNGNGAEAFRTYTALLDWIEASFSPYFSTSIDWEAIGEKEKIPRNLAKRVRSQSAQLASIEAAIPSLDKKVAEINAAHDAALALPTDLESLSEARETINKLAMDAKNESKSLSAAADHIKSLVAEMETKKDEVVKIVRRAEEAYSAATTMGLGAAFESRAKSLSTSMWIWVGGLLIALIAGGTIGWLRISLVESLIKSNASTVSISLNTFLSFLSIAAPIWFAWIATKQIGQRFRLSEDYAFKASVAKAYEGYRREAVSIDPVFAKRLFASALDRLDEAPLRFVEHETHGSPWHEAIMKNSNRKNNTETSSRTSDTKSLPSESLNEATFEQITENE